VTHPGFIKLSDEEVAALSAYLRNGGVMLVNDFWSQPDWDRFEEQMRVVLPTQNWSELGTDHPISTALRYPGSDAAAAGANPPVLGQELRSPPIRTRVCSG